MTALQPFLPQLRRVGHEAGSLSPELPPELVALSIAHILCLGWFTSAFIKSEPCQPGYLTRIPAD